MNHRLKNKYMRSFDKVTTTTYKPLWIRPKFTTYSKKYEEIRKRMKEPMVSCVRCDHKFEYGETVALAGFEQIGNNTLCNPCATYLNEELPDTLIRIEDGQEFILNDNGTYSNKSLLSFKAQGHLISEWTWKCLMETNEGSFRIK